MTICRDHFSSFDRIPRKCSHANIVPHNTPIQNDKNIRVLFLKKLAIIIRTKKTEKEKKILPLIGRIESNRDVEICLSKKQFVH